MASKAAGFVALILMVFVAFPQAKDVYAAVLLGARRADDDRRQRARPAQTNIVRMLAYSAISQGGFILMPLAVAGTRRGRARR